jgi:hypothetical protein
MVISTFDGLIGSAKQYITMVKTASRTSVAAQWTSVYGLAGNPGAGVLAGTSTTTGIVPTDATSEHPTINAFGGGAAGYLAQVEFGGSTGCRIRLHDLLWKGGAYAFNAAISGQTPASFSSRVPGGTDFTDTQIWYEQVTAGTGVPSVNVSYNDQAGAASTTGVTALPAAMIVGRCFQLPLAAGDTGVQGITGVTATVATVGTFNLLVTRPIWTGRCKIANDGDMHGPDKTLLAPIYADSALMMMVAPDATATGFPELELVIANG